MVNLEELKEQIRKRREKREFISKELKKEDLITREKLKEGLARARPTQATIKKYLKQPKVTKTGRHIQSRIRQLVAGVKRGVKSQARQMAINKQRQFIMQQRMQQQMEAERIAMQQDPRFRQQTQDDFADFPQEQERPQEEFVEDEYGRQQKGPGMFSGVGEAFRKWRVGQQMRAQGRLQERPGFSPQQQTEVPRTLLAPPVHNILAPQQNNMLTPQGSKELVREPKPFFSSPEQRTQSTIPVRLKVW